MTLEQRIATLEAQVAKQRAAEECTQHIRQLVVDVCIAKQSLNLAQRNYKDKVDVLDRGVLEWGTMGEGRV